MANPICQTKMINLIDFDETRCSGVFEVTNHESEHKLCISRITAQFCVHSTIHQLSYNILLSEYEVMIEIVHGARISLRSVTIQESSGLLIRSAKPKNVLSSDL